MTRYVAIAEIRSALSFGPTTCRYHGQDFGFLGTENGLPWGEPRCESCKQPWRVTRALRALDQLDARVIELQAQAREAGQIRDALTEAIERIDYLTSHPDGRTALDEHPGDWSQVVAGVESMRDELRYMRRARDEAEREVTR